MYIGIDSLAMDMKDKKLTVIGTVDLVNVVSKLRKYWQTDIILVGPAKEPEKKEEAKKEEAKKEEPKKEPKKEEARRRKPRRKKNPRKKKRRRKKRRRKNRHLHRTRFWSLSRHTKLIILTSPPITMFKALKRIQMLVLSAKLGDKFRRKDLISSQLYLKGLFGP